MRSFVCGLLNVMIGAVLSSPFGPAASLAAPVIATGGPLLQIDTRSDDEGSSTTSPTFAIVPNAQVKIKIPSAGGSRLIVARFSGASYCSAATDFLGHCYVRIVAVNIATHTATELNPRFDQSAAFDSSSSDEPNTDYVESHAIERSVRLGPGNYAIRAQLSVTGGDGKIFILNNWHFTVEQYN